MKSLALILLAGVLVTQARGQGLLAIGQNVDYTENVPLTFSVKVSGGYDHINYPNIPSGVSNLDSYFIQTGVGLTYADISKVTPWNVSTDLGVLRYLNNPLNGDKLYYNSRVALNFAHSFSKRLKVSDNFYVAYEIEPDFGIGITTGRLAGQYLYGYNNLSVAYAWTERFSTTTGWTIQGIRYEDNRAANAVNDLYTNTFSQQFSYSLSPSTSVNAEYRYATTNYPNPSRNGLASPDYRSHYLLVGVDQAWSQRLTGSLRAGAEFYESDRVNKTAPYVEASLNYKLNRRTNVRWYNELGFDGSSLGQYNSRYAYRTGVVANYQVAEHLSFNAGIHYVHDDYQGNTQITSSNDNEVDLNIGFTLGLWKNVALDANYSYTTIASDVNLNDYSRSRVNVGLNATF